MKKPIVFVITPFGEDFIALYDYLKKEFADSFHFTNGGDLDKLQNALQPSFTYEDLAKYVIFQMYDYKYILTEELLLRRARYEKTRQTHSPCAVIDEIFCQGG